ncbi:MAG: hypothetical protein DI594_01135 [Shewanella oneidensis]|nr:MAG: hypothetical protein DI594_01135 [Shewanella oneidensis]
MNESYGRSHASLHCTTFRRPAYQMANWPLNRDVDQVHPLTQGSPSYVNGSTNTAMVWMQKSGRGRTVVSLITTTHPPCIGVACRF